MLKISKKTTLSSHAVKEPCLLTHSTCSHRHTCTPTYTDAQACAHMQNMPIRAHTHMAHAHRCTEPCTHTAHAHMHGHTHKGAHSTCTQACTHSRTHTAHAHIYRHKCTNTSLPMGTVWRRQSHQETRTCLLEIKRKTQHNCLTWLGGRHWILGITPYTLARASLKSAT